MTLHCPLTTPFLPSLTQKTRMYSPQIRSPVFIVVTLLLATSNLFQCLTTASNAQHEDPSSSPQEMLVQAVRADDPVTIEKAILEFGADINLQGVGAQTPLVSAVLGGKLHAVEKLLALGADVTIPEKDGYTVMHAAGFQGRSAILKLLAAHNDGAINTMEQHSDGYFPLHRACWGRELRHADTVQTFLELGVPPDLEAGNGKTCLTMTSNPKTLSLIEAAMEEKKSETEL